MKVLRIYDHLGELKKELNIFVEGEDFKYQTVTPECIWLGTIVLEEAGKEPEPAPKWMPVEEPITEEEAATLEQEGYEDAMREQEMVQEDEAQRYRDMKQAAIDLGYIEPNEDEEAEVEPPAPFTTQLTTTEEAQEEEAKHEPKKVHRKRSRKSRTHPSDYLKSLKVIREDDSGADVTEGD